MQPNWQDVKELTKQTMDIKTEYWLHENLFTSSWWILLVTTIIVLIIWLILLDKKRIFEIITYGFFVASVAMIGDAIGVMLWLWIYPNTLFPLPLIVEIHRIQMPFIYMLIYQYFPGWKAFFIASTINAFIFAFVFEPTLVWLQIYETIHWKFIYSFIPYILIAVGFKFLIHKFKKMDQNYDG
ncbi:CBO0543 family protein [Oceanobacillus jeddahense]|uniref:CBO0543 family protein n=1 Tax=Oceanobacillus jeddahense TaxID=1462527 RepID=UPI0005960501|nr:CBO0543 family protein [Oceanobacillus jeddahense]